jgi:hypothetical protein
MAYAIRMPVRHSFSEGGFFDMFRPPGRHEIPRLDFPHFAPLGERSESKPRPVKVSQSWSK